MPVEATKIKAIPLHLDRQDSVVWMGTPTGIFTTRNAYQMMVKDKNNALGSSSNPVRRHSFWKGIWRAKVPHKIRMFMWRACSSIFPTKTNFFKRGIVSSLSCPNCQEEVETILHVLWDCDFAKECWIHSPLSHLSNTLHLARWSDVVEHVLRKEGLLEQEIFFVLAWLIWKGRNDTLA